MGRKEQVSVLAVAANIFLFVIKLVVGIISGSYAILADAINSASDIFASTINYLGIRLSQRPADENHPYGHHKYEVLFGLFVTLIIFGSALYILYKAIIGLFDPVEVTVNTLSIGVMVVSALTNEVMARIKIHTGKNENSLSLVADGVHSRVDVLSSAGVLIGLILTPYWIYSDSLVALLVGVWILKESVSLGKEATDNLLDVAADAEKEESVRSIVQREGYSVTELKTQKRGNAFTANLTLALPKNMSVNRATTLSEDLRKKLMDELGDLSYVTISFEGKNVQTNYYRGFGGGYSWRSRKKPPEYCVCPHCGHREKHERGVPCRTKTCPYCEKQMEGEHAQAQT